MKIVLNPDTDAQVHKDIGYVLVVLSDGSQYRLGEHRSGQLAIRCPEEFDVTPKSASGVNLEVRE